MPKSINKYLLSIPHQETERFQTDNLTPWRTIISWESVASKLSGGNVILHEAETHSYKTWLQTVTMIITVRLVVWFVFAVWLPRHAGYLKRVRAVSHSPKPPQHPAHCQWGNNTAPGESEWPQPPDRPWQSKELAALMRTHVRMSLWKSCLRI